MKIDFRIENNENRGAYFAETERIDIWPLQHECIEDLFFTITHETIHYAIDKALEHDDSENIDDDQEERLIYRIQWAPEWIT